MTAPAVSERRKPPRRERSRPVSEINYVVGDATQPHGEGVKFIAHISNDVGGWGSGFVVALSRRSRTPENCYRRWAKEGVYEGAPFKLGEVQLADFTTPSIKVVNMIAQSGIRHSHDDARAVRYSALRKCTDGLGQLATRWASFGSAPSIHMPRIGCGLGGGEWAQVEEIILESLVDVYGLSVTVYDLPKEAT